MPPLPLAKILNVALPFLSGEARAVLDVLACKNGLLPPAGDVATFLGLRTRHQVARTLRRGRRGARAWSRAAVPSGVRWSFGPRAAFLIRRATPRGSRVASWRPG